MSSEFLRKLKTFIELLENGYIPKRVFMDAIAMLINKEKNEKDST